MKFFTYISEENVHLAPDVKRIPAKLYTKFITAKKVLKKAQEEAEKFRIEVASEIELSKERAELAGFEAGLNEWMQQIALLENEIIKVRKDMENVIVTLALTAAKRIVGREIELKSDTVVDIVATALKSVSQHRKVAIYVNRGDLDILESQRPRLKQVFERLESLSIQARDDVTPHGCIIETEAGIINAQLENLWAALENAFQNLIKGQKKEES